MIKIAIIRKIKINNRLHRRFTTIRDTEQYSEDHRRR